MTHLVFGATLFAIIYLAIEIHYRYERRRDQLWFQACKYHDLMFHKLQELRNDPTMSDRKWAAWLPVFEYADNFYAQHDYHNLGFNRFSDWIRNEIDDDSY